MHTLFVLCVIKFSRVKSVKNYSDGLCDCYLGEKCLIKHFVDKSNYV